MECPESSQIDSNNKQRNTLLIIITNLIQRAAAALTHLLPQNLHLLLKNIKMEFSENSRIDSNTTNLEDT